MIFNVTTIGTNQTTEQYLIESDSWSNCVSYLEGLEKQIANISKQPEPITIVPVANVSGITNCFIVTETSVTNIPTQHYVWENNIETLFNWIESQEMVSIRNITNQQITYVVID
jgi:hypothetical protein